MCQEKLLFRLTFRIISGSTRSISHCAAVADTAGTRRSGVGPAKLAMATGARRAATMLRAPCYIHDSGLGRVRPIIRGHTITGSEAADC
jgi:hypothetical protein